METPWDSKRSSFFRISEVWEVMYWVFSVSVEWRFCKVRWRESQRVVREARVGGDAREDILYVESERLQEGVFC